MAGRRILILGGTADAVDLARRLDETEGIHVTTSLAGVTRAPRRPPGDLRSGGFGGVDGLAAYLLEEGVDAVIDATHPFAGQISRHAAEAASKTGLPVLFLRRAAWAPGQGDIWHEVGDVSAAADWLDGSALPENAVVFLTVGRREIGQFARVPRFRYIARSVEAPDTGSLTLAELILARGPFSLEDEIELLKRHDVACLVAKNAGGRASHAKIEAARTLGVPVVMIRQPPPPMGESVASVDAAAAWVMQGA